ncbi:E3 ubiquitin-protein ligase RNF4-like isoform X1 [Ananas comosus]|uniref:E3 ubiquitin-protein ligase RNF4-like isoform X1 n=2 Tax=Ananas comosus TaxID=4615 RepID=A0A6P5F7B4_ANACO|nr:E3 ubiquitin-protein ligase RNF4-like isoform X1 [Ananas comosus]CAD1839081.1 unnamed protein product [Ananas comosus var. bracteatus]
MSALGPTRRSMKRRGREIPLGKEVFDLDLNSLPVEIADATSASNVGLNRAPIDVDAIEDEVQLLSSSRGVPQTRARSRREHPATIILDDDSESGVSIRNNESRTAPLNRTGTNYDVYQDLEGGYSAKKKDVVKSNPGPVVKEVPKEPTFTCPVCMNTMVEPSSTICGHVFCKGCIKAAIQVQKRCPNCRRKLTVNNFHRVYLPNSE